MQFIWKCIETLPLCYCTTQNCNQLSHCWLNKFSPKHSPIKTKPQHHLSKGWTIKIFWPISNKLLFFSNLKFALVDHEILEKRYITLTCNLYWNWNSLKGFRHKHARILAHPKRMVIPNTLNLALTIWKNWHKSMKHVMQHIKLGMTYIKHGISYMHCLHLTSQIFINSTPC